MMGASGGPFFPHAAKATKDPHTITREHHEEVLRILEITNTQILLRDLRNLRGLRLLLGRCRLFRRHWLIDVGAADHSTSGIRRPEAAHVDAEIPHLVVEDALRRIEQPRRFGAVAAGRFQRVLNEIPLESLDRIFQRHAGDRT